MIGGVRIRLADLRDSSAIARVQVDTWRTTYVGIVPDEHLANLSYESREQRQHDYLRTDNQRYAFVAENEQGQVVGFAFGGPERENDLVYHGELYGLYILKAYQRQGIGQQLVGAIAQRLRAAGFTNMLIWVLAENPACGFYAALGGKPVREKKVSIGGKELREIGYGWDDITGMFENK
jgi:GNAT superfamily N-acetyltransferase